MRFDIAISDTLLAALEGAPTSGGNIASDDHVPALTPFQRARLGKITGSNFHKVTRGRAGKGWSATAESYLDELVWEWMSGRPAQNFDGSRATEWGNRHETEAIELYQQITGRAVVRNKFYEAPGFQGLVGCTPDGVGETHGLEVKCPYNPKNHVRTIRSKQVPSEYQDQCYGHMLCTGRYFCDFVSYDPRLPDEYKMAVVLVEADAAEMEDLRERLADFELLLIESLTEIGIDWTAPNWML